jgi:hypothetical protein
MGIPNDNYHHGGRRARGGRDRFLLRNHDLCLSHDLRINISPLLPQALHPRGFCFEVTLAPSLGIPTGLSYALNLRAP